MEETAVSNDSEYRRGFEDGLQAALGLIQAGVEPEQLAACLPANDFADSGAYTGWLRELRMILGADTPGEER